VTDTRHYVRTARLIPATGGPVIADGIVEIDGTRISRVGSAAEFAEEMADARVDHFPDGTVLPGMVDAHAHLSLAADRA